MRFVINIEGVELAYVGYFDQQAGTPPACAGQILRGTVWSCFTKQNNIFLLSKNNLLFQVNSIAHFIKDGISDV